MQTIAQAFQAFLQKLELTASETKKASDQHIYMRTQLQQRLSIADNFLSGSYARNTAIRPLNDIDIFVVLKETFRHDLRTSEALKTIATALGTVYPNKTVRLQSRSVKIEFSGTGIAYDVVPAFASGGGVYMIPDSDTASWIKTNPRIHMALSTQANERANKKLKPLLKAIKHSNNFHNQPARSFHLEALSWGILTSDPGSYMDGLTTLLDGLVRQINQACPDPAKLGSSIRPSSTVAAQQWLNTMAKLARDARNFAAQGRLADAHGNMRKIFGPQWPQKGTSS
jgi:predicted nucleotidyltransferase